MVPADSVFVRSEACGYRVSGAPAVYTFTGGASSSHGGKPMRSSILLVVGLAGLLFAGCTRSTAVPASDANLTPRDRELLANAPYAAATIPEPYRKHLVDYPGAETPGTILIDTDARFLYYVLPSRKAIRYGVAVGEEAVAWSGVAQVGRRRNGRTGSRHPTSRRGSV